VTDASGSPTSRALLPVGRSADGPSAEGVGPARSGVDSTAARSAGPVAAVGGAGLLRADSGVSVGGVGDPAAEDGPAESLSWAPGLG
jgi:hypothetical protein